MLGPNSVPIRGGPWSELELKVRNGSLVRNRAIWRQNGPKSEKFGPTCLLCPRQETGVWEELTRRARNAPLSTVSGTLCVNQSEVGIFNPYVDLLTVTGVQFVQTQVTFKVSLARLRWIPWVISSQHFLSVMSGTPAR
eukprot:m.163065 g.163065  ORF g.163065 m.163065 type:complete len:138 (+) comp14619_c0_seq1:105-518(+)